MAVKLFDSELKVMDVLWKEGDMPAKQISDILKESTGWNMNTTYTVIKKCIAKGAIERREPNFLCHALIARDVVQACLLPQSICRWWASIWHRAGYLFQKHRLWEYPLAHLHRLE